jgi:hypothetical protein
MFFKKQLDGSTGCQEIYCVVTMFISLIAQVFLLSLVLKNYVCRKVGEW